jgi:hypothetical protein
MHRWVWDLHYTAPTAVDPQYPISAVPHATPRVPQGPLALPGRYTVRLTANGRTVTAPLTVTMDPRVQTPAAGLAQMFEVETRLAGMLDRSSVALLSARSLQAQLTALGKETSATGGALAAMQRELTGLLEGTNEEMSAKAAAKRPAKTAEAATQQPAPAAAPAVTLSDVQGDLSTLYEMIDRADATPTAAQLAAVSATAVKFDTVMKKWSALESVTLPRLNAALQRAKLKALVSGADPAMRGGGVHEE